MPGFGLVQHVVLSCADLYPVAGGRYRPVPRAPLPARLRGSIS